MNSFDRETRFPSRRVVRPHERVQAEVVAEKILEFLQTSKSYKLEEIAKAVELPNDQINNILNFLAEANLVEKGFRITEFGLSLLKMPTE